MISAIASLPDEVLLQRQIQRLPGMTSPGGIDPSPRQIQNHTWEWRQRGMVPPGDSVAAYWSLWRYFSMGNSNISRLVLITFGLDAVFTLLMTTDQGNDTTRFSFPVTQKRTN